MEDSDIRHVIQDALLGNVDIICKECIYFENITF